MKIAFFTDIYYPQISGIVENVETSAKALRALGHEVFIVAPKTPGKQLEDKHIIWLPSVKVRQDPELRFIIPFPDSTIRNLMKMDFDIIHAHAGGLICFLGWEIARRKKIPYVLTYHTLLNRYTHYFLKGKVITPKMSEIGSRVFCNLCTQVIVPTQIVKKELRKYGFRKNIEVVPGGIDLDKFSRPEKGFLRTKFNISPTELIILYVGRLGKEKNIGFLLDAFGKLKDKQNARLVIVGDGPEKSTLLEHAKRLGISEKVVFTGFVPREEVGKVYFDSDIFVFSSKTETQGLVIPEAMAARLPVLVVADGAFKEIVYNQKTGLVSKDSVENFAKNLDTLLADPDLRLRLGNAARKLVEEEYSARAQAQALVKIYKKSLRIKKGKLRERGVVKKSLVSLADFFKITQSFNQFKSIMRFVNGYYNS